MIEYTDDEVDAYYREVRQEATVRFREKTKGLPRKVRAPRHPWSVCLSGAKQRARERKMYYTLSDSWAETVWTGKCALTGIEFVKSDKGLSPFSPSIDRIDATQGYTTQNCRFILNCLNIFKGKMTDSQMLSIAKALVENDKNVQGT